jgi:hypothetical protein
LAHLVEPRRRLVGDTVRLTHRLTSALKHSCPQVLQGLQDQDPALFGDFLRRWPPLQAVHLARRTPLERFCRAHHGRSADVITTRIEAIKNAVARTTDAGVSAPHTFLGPALGAQLRVPWPAMAACDTAMAQRAHAPPAFPWFAALPGAVLAPRLLVAFGVPRERFTAAEARQNYAGIAPATACRGKTSWGPWRLQWPTCLRQTCVAWAAESLRHAFWAQVYYQQPRAQGTAPQAAVRALACPWRRILSRCGQERLPSAESTSLPALHRRGSSLIQNLAKAS